MNSARAAKTWKTSRPPDVVVSRFREAKVNPMPRRRRSPTVAIRSCKERDSRSRDGTTKVSPGCMKSRQATSSDRSVSRADCFSAKIRRHPAAVSASSWRSSFCPPVETRAYPIRMLVCWRCRTWQRVAARLATRSSAVHLTLLGDFLVAGGDVAAGAGHKHSRRCHGRQRRPFHQVVRAPPR